MLLLSVAWREDYLHAPYTHLQIGAGHAISVFRMDVQPAADVLQPLLAECEVKLVHFAPQNISNMLWACATLSISPGSLTIPLQQS